MCDFHDFGLTWKCKKMCCGWLHDQSFLKFFLTPLHGPFGIAPFKNISKNVDLAFEVNSALSSENETKIVKITHNAELHMMSFWTILLQKFFVVVIHTNIIHNHIRRLWTASLFKFIHILGSLPYYITYNFYNFFVFLNHDMVRTHQNCYFFGRNSGMGSLDHS